MKICVKIAGKQDIHVGVKDNVNSRVLLIMMMHVNYRVIKDARTKLKQDPKSIFDLDVSEMMG